MKVLALVLVAALALALPLTGCKPKAPVSQGDTGGSTGGTSGAGTTGGTPPAAWAYCQLAAGEHVKYTITAGGGGQAVNGWFTWDISDAGGGKLKIAYAGNWAGQSFSGDATVGATTVAADLVPAFQSNPFAMIAVLPIVTTPWGAYFSGAQWEVGKSWSWSGGGTSMTFSLTGEETYAGIKGYAGQWVATVRRPDRDQHVLRESELPPGPAHHDRVHGEQA